MIDKQTLRNRYKAARLALPSEEIADKSEAIRKKFFDEVDLDKVKSAYIYRPIPGLNEVDTNSLTADLAERYPEIKITVGGNLKDTPQPKGKFDLIIVPLLGFDKDNYRLGWGGGWYDRFLATQPQALKIGLCFTNGLVPESLPRESHDIPLDKVITEV